MIARLLTYIKYCSGLCLLCILSLYGFFYYSQLNAGDDSFKVFFLFRKNNSALYIQRGLRTATVSLTETIFDEARVLMPTFKKQIDSYFIFKSFNKKVENSGCFNPTYFSQRLLSITSVVCMYSGVFSSSAKTYKAQGVQKYFAQTETQKNKIENYFGFTVEREFYKQKKTTYMFNYLTLRQKDISIALLPLTKSQIEKVQNELILSSSAKLFGTACIFTKQKVFIFDRSNKTYKQKMVSDFVGNQSFVNLSDVCLFD